MSGPREVSKRTAVLGVAAAGLLAVACLSLLLAVPQADVEGPAELRLAGVDGEAFALSDYRGKVVLLVIGDAGEPVWADGYADVEALVRRYAEVEDVEVLAVQQRAGDVPEPRTASGVPVLADPAGRAGVAFGTSGRSVVVVAPTGQVAAVGGVEQAAGAVATLLAMRS